jgi:hypothetical protein
MIFCDPCKVVVQQIIKNLTYVNIPTYNYND